MPAKNGIWKRIEQLFFQALTKEDDAALLTRWAEESNKPIMLLMEEVDALVEETLVSLLRHLRKGYTQLRGNL